MSMHIGAPAKPVVNIGDTVKVGTLIAEAGGAVSAPVHASVSGKVAKIVDFLLADGRTVPAIVIESDGEMTPDETIAPPVVDSRESFIEAVKNSGIVGLGGAGFPTHFKLNADPAKIEYLIVNGAECEPYVTSDTLTMENRGDDMATALEAVKKWLGVKNIVIGVESNKKKAIIKMNELAAAVGAQVKVLPSIYPQGGEKVLIYNCTGHIVGEGKLPLDVGCIVLNVTTTVELMKYLATGMPLVERCLTVDGSAVKEPKNVIVPIGTRMQDVFDFCGGFQSEPGKILYGGPMMGIAVPDAGFPVMKTTNAIVALNERDAILPDPTPCIRCGKCANTCPLHLTPFAIGEAVQKKDAGELAKLKVTLCMECGCCSFICPAHRPLVQQNKLGKAILKAATPPKGGK